MKAPRISSSVLRDCALKQMTELGNPLERLPAKSRAMLYKMRNGETVRLRTTNDPILIVVAESADPESSLNIEGTDHLLVVMPETPRAPGPVRSYLIPADVAAAVVRKAHQEWLDSKPNTKGDNRTRNIWFEDTGRPSGNFEEKWSEYLLPVSASTIEMEGAALGSSRPAISEPQYDPVAKHTSETVADVIENARGRISTLTGMPTDAIQIEVKIGGDGSRR